MNITRKRFVTEKMGRKPGQYPHIVRVLGGSLNASPRLAKAIAAAMGMPGDWIIFHDGTKRDREIAWRKFRKTWKQGEAIKGMKRMAKEAA